MVAESVSGSISPLIFKMALDRLRGQAVCPSHFTAREIAGVGGCVSAGAVLDFFKKEMGLFLLSNFEQKMFQCISWSLY